MSLSCRELNEHSSIKGNTNSSKNTVKRISPGKI